MNKYEELMNQKDWYQSEALRFKDDEEKAAAFKMLADDLEQKARELPLKEMCHV